ncbi:MAG: L-rhamnonate dehydratase [Azospirillaceae bacterium]
MKIKKVRTRVVEWQGETVAPTTKMCTSAADLVTFGEDATMAAYSFHGWLLVEIETDDGHVGIGNAALSPRVTKQVIDLYLAPIVIGADPFDIELLWQRMYRQTLPFGRKGIGMTAISAVDIALWDLVGKLTGKPVFKLLGGRTKARIPVYASKLYAQPLDRLVEEARQYKEAGFKAMKQRLGYGPTDGAAGMRRNVELVRAVREEIGDEIDLMADVYMGWTYEYAKRMLPMLEPYELRWLEEAVIADDIDGYAGLRDVSRVPISGGEHEFTIFGFRRILESKALDVIQFDTNRVGGISQARKIMAMAEAWQIPVIPHAGQMHNYHLVMSSVASPMAEYFPLFDVEIGNELFQYIFKGEPVAENGSIDLDDSAPGLGLAIDEAALRDFRIEE